MINEFLIEKPQSALISLPPLEEGLDPLKYYTIKKDISKEKLISLFCYYEEPTLKLKLTEKSFSTFQQATIESILSIYQSQRKTKSFDRVLGILKSEEVTYPTLLYESTQLLGLNQDEAIRNFMFGRTKTIHEVYEHADPIEMFNIFLKVLEFFQFKSFSSFYSSIFWFYPFKDRKRFNILLDETYGFIKDKDIIKIYKSSAKDKYLSSDGLIMRTSLSDLMNEHIIKPKPKLETIEDISKEIEKKIDAGILPDREKIHLIVEEYMKGGTSEEQVREIRMKLNKFACKKLRK